VGQVRRGLGERLAAWLYTGPLGHFWSTAADLADFFLRSLRTRAQRRLAGDGNRLRARR
jgi:hypothetical protein